MKPAFRADAPYPIRYDSRRTIRALGASSPSRRAAARPVTPAPTTAQSTVCAPSSRVAGAASGSMAYQPGAWLMSVRRESFCGNVQYHQAIWQIDVNDIDSMPSEMRQSCENPRRIAAPTNVATFSRGRPEPRATSRTVFPSFRAEPGRRRRPSPTMSPGRPVPFPSACQDRRI